MIQKTGTKPEKLFELFVSNWFELISKGKWSEAFVQIDLPTSYGYEYNPEKFRDEIGNDHFCRGTIFRKQYPEIIYSNPKEIKGNGRLIILQDDDTLDCEFYFDVPLNGEFSDLTSIWEFINFGEFYKVRLESLHVL